MAGWKTPPPVGALVDAGYTNILVAFGVFSTSQPGPIVSAFDTVTASYIASLRAAGITVTLSLGGASSSVPDTTVNFHQALAAATSEDAFVGAFVQSVRGLMATFGFQGVDIDVEHGLGVGGTFDQPTGDVAVMIRILSQLRQGDPDIVLSLAPQTANIAATASLDATWANYACLLSHTQPLLAWVGVQLYNTGCMLGIDQQCYANLGGADQTFSVVMATDLLEDWPAVDSAGRRTGFQPYVSTLRTDQVVLGYPSPDKYFASDGAPVTLTSAIVEAIQCLKTGLSGCDLDTANGGYRPPRGYGMVGGVFNWEVSYDQSNSFRFAKDLQPCVLHGQCA